MLAIPLLAPAPAGASGEERSFELVALDSTAEVAPDGSMVVTEEVTYSFDGAPFTIGIRSFLPEDRDRISEFTASADGVPLTTYDPAGTPTGEWEWALTDEVADDVPNDSLAVTFTLRYRVEQAVTVGSDVGELYWQFLGTDHTGVDEVRVTIALPDSFPVARDDAAADDASVLRAWGHGPRQGVVDVDPDRVQLRVADVPAGRFVEARVVIPGDAFDVDATSGPRLPAILAEESADVERTLAEDRGRAYEPPPSTLARLLGPAGALLGLVGAGAIWSRFGREPRPDPLVGEYWREPLTDPPAVVLANRKKGTPQLGTAIGATLIDLAQRGHLTIREEREERLGPDRVVHHLTRTGPGDQLEAFETRLLRYVFASGAETTTEEITDRAAAARTDAAAFAKGFLADIGAAHTRRGYQQPRARGVRWVVALVVAVALVGVVALVLGSALGFVAVVGAPAAGVVAAVGLRNRTQAGADEAAKAAGLERFLRDFSNLEDAPVGHLILWERFLVYAVTFGVSGALLRGLAARLPAVVHDPAFGAWYLGSDPARRLDTIDRFPGEFGRATAQALVPPSSSGSGGGFSTGGGGGGGGGGFGAR